MNLDDKVEFVLNGQHLSALNIRFYGGANGMTAQNYPGNVEIVFDLPAGSNECLGSVFDQLKHRIIWFNWNSNNRHGIYQYSLTTNLVTNLLLCFTDSQTDILEFDLDYPIASVNIIYTTEEDGDILTWTVRNNKPKELNILDAENDLFGANWLAEYLDVCKQPPTIPPICAYENDATSIVNNLYGSGGYKLYRFRELFEYGDFQQSAPGSISKMPIPFDYTDQDVVTDPTKNCRIGIVIQTGGADVVKLHVWAQENIGVTWGKFFNIAILDKAELGIPDNDTYIHYFSNNEAYDYVDPLLADLDFDRVPDRANTQELLNGNVIIYGGITEGLDPIVPDVALEVQDDDISNVGYPVEASVTQAGTNGLNIGEDITIRLVGQPAFASLGQGSAVDITIVVGASTFFINCATPLITTTIADLITQLSVSASGFGFTIVSSTSNSLVIRRTNQVLSHFVSYGNGNNIKPVNESVPANDFSSKHNYAIAYFAEKQKNNGATTSESFVGQITPIDFDAPASTFDLTQVQLTINNRPPIWAKNWQLLRTNNLTSENKVSLVSDRTFKDDLFGYISIEPLNTYKVQYETSVLSYDFVNGDRIKFCCLFNNDKTVANDYGNSHDYEIVGQVVNPNINGLVQGGTFVKINLPTTSGSFDFGNFLSNTYYFYYIKLYTPSKSVANNLDVYYEVGEMFEVGEPGLATRYHQGNTQNQTSDGLTPAISIFKGGDSWYRLREIRAGAYFRANTVPNVTYSWAGEPVYQQTIENIPVGTSYTVKNTTAGNSSNTNNWLIKTSVTQAVNFNVKGKLTFQALATTTNRLLILILTRTVGGGASQIIQLAERPTGAANGQIIEFDIDVNITIPANNFVIIYLQESPVSSTPFSANALSGQITFIDTEHDFTIGVIDPNFSDFFESKINSNGRPLVVNPDEKTIKFGTLSRWGLAYQQNTNINQINRFYPANFDEIDRQKGEIQRFKARDRMLRVFQNRACAQYGIYSQFVSNNQGQKELIKTDTIITKGNIFYYSGEYGMGEQYTGLVSSKNVDYIADPVIGYELRLSNDGITPTSQLYKADFYLKPKITQYNKDWSRQGGGIAKILGTYSYFDEELVRLLQAGGSQDNGIPAYCYTFNEKRNGFSSFLSLTEAEWLENGNDILFAWKNGRLWQMNIGNPSGSYCSYFGTQYSCYITLVFNMSLLEVKTWEAVGEVASQIWNCPLIYTSTFTYSGQRQESELINQDFADLEGEFKSAFLRDIHSYGGLINGDILKGNLLVATFQIDTPTSQATLSQVTVMTKDSPLNVK